MFRHLATLWRYREMVANLVVRDLKVKYKGSALGFAWSFLNPAIMIGLYYLIFSVFVPDFRAIDNYGLFLIAGMWPWMTFASAAGKSAPLFILQGDLLRKVYFPREVLPLATVLAEFVNFFIGLALFLGVLIATGHAPGAQVAYLLPLIGALFGLTFGVALLVSAYDVFYRDLEQILNSSLTILFFATPVVYTLKQVADAATTYRWVDTWLTVNPLAWLLPAFRHVLLGANPEDALQAALPVVVWGCFGGATLFLLVSYARFKGLEYQIVEEV